jgi:hypothetical protein
MSMDAILKRCMPAIQLILAEAITEAATRTDPIIRLWASEIGGYLGKDAWTSRDKALATVWKRTDEVQYKEVSEQWKLNGGELQKKPEKSVAMRTRKDPYPDVKTMDDIIQFRKDASQEEVLKLYRSKGYLFEESVALDYGASIDQPVINRNTSTIWSYPQGSTLPYYKASVPIPEDTNITSPGPFTIVGEVDGWLQTPPTIVEFKLRMQRIPDTIPERDMLQVQTYLHMNNVEQAAYVQTLFGTRSMVVKHIQRDTDMWNTCIYPGIIKFVCDVRKVLRGEALEDLQLRHRALKSVESVTASAMAPLPPTPIPPIISAKTVKRGSGPTPIKRRKKTAVVQEIPMPDAFEPLPDGPIPKPRKILTRSCTRRVCST